MAKFLTESFKRNLLLTANPNYGLETFNDCRTALQNYQQFFICKHFEIKEPIEVYMSAEFLVMVGLTRCNRLLRFTICPLGLYKIAVIPFFGGNNTPFTQITIKETIKNQLTCLK